MPSINLNLDYANAARLMTPMVDSIGLTLIGCGGTGSWLAPAVARVGRLLMERYEKEVQIVFIDPDHVEEKNVYRQNFCQAEIGRNKAETLAFRYGSAWGLEIGAVAARFTDDHMQIFDFGYRGWLRVLIGCVDNAAARKAIDHVISCASEYTWWLDSGNEKSSGQVLSGCGGKQPADPFQLPGFCSWLPLPSDQHPELLNSTSQEAAGEEAALSCAEMALQDSQGLAINQRMAAEAADYLVRMLITQDLRKMATYIDLESGVSRSRYITPKNVSMETVKNA